MRKITFRYNFLYYRTQSIIYVKTFEIDLIKIIFFCGIFHDSYNCDNMFRNKTKLYSKKFERNIKNCRFVSQNFSKIIKERPKIKKLKKTKEHFFLSFFPFDICNDGKSDMSSLILFVKCSHFLKNQKRKFLKRTPRIKLIKISNRYKNSI